MKRLLHAGGQALYCAVCVALCAALLFRGDTVREGGKAGLTACAQVVIPSLYLFMALSGTIAQSRTGELLSRPLSLLTRRVLKLPACMGPAVLLSAIGGYPVGAKTIAILLERRQIAREDAERALCFCCNAGPSFVITAVGAHLLASARAGAILLFIHLLCSLFIGIFLSLRLPVPAKRERPAEGLPFGEAFILGVNGATSGILTICAYVVIFSALGALLRESGIFVRLSFLLSPLLPPSEAAETLGALFLGLMEVTTGCMAAAALPGRLPLLLLPFFISFAGLSIFFQIRATLQPYRLRFAPFLFCRVLHGLLSALLSYPLLRLESSAAAAFKSAAAAIPYRTPNTPSVTLLMLAVSAMTLWSLAPSGKTKEEAGGKPAKKKINR